MCSSVSSTTSSTVSSSVESSPSALEEEEEKHHLPDRLRHHRLQQQPLCAPSTSASGSGSSSPGTTEMASYPLIPRDQLEVQEQLGVGTYGSVFKGIWEKPDGRSLAVALKKVFMLEKEVDILSQIRHRNIIQFYGVSQANPDFFIVTEYAENGSLYEHLHNKSEQISLERTIKWAMQIARGVAYLHNEAPITVIHRDLKSKNVVIGKKFQCKLCDFGTSKDLTHSWTAPSWGGTAAWMSPEIISQHEGITTATDVWSFAVVLWEMFSRQVPYQGLTEFKIYSIISQHGVRLCIPDTCPEPLAQLLRSCWSQNPKERPDMRCVLTVLERMNRDKDLRAECAHFLDQSKEEWRERIQEQLRELDALKLDLARQMEDLKRREQALRKRENSHRNFLHMVDILNVENVCEWNEDCVCEWVQNIAAATVADFPEATVDKIISCVLQYSITGPRLLKITEKDLECLGIEPVALRRYITLKMDELRAMNVQLCNVPNCCPPDSADSGNGSSLASAEPPLDCSIVLHVGLYSRMVLPGPSYRFKVFLDSDWEPGNGNANNGEDTAVPSPELQDSATVIKEVSITMSAADQTNFLGPVQCICPPFGYLEWAQLCCRDAEQKKKLPLTLSLVITYTDQVIQPRNTRIQIRLDDLSNGPRTLCNRRVPLKLRATPTDTSLSRISSSLQRNPLKSPPATFRSRRRSLGLSGSISPADDCTRPLALVSASSSNLLNRSPAWADLAASIRNSSCLAQFRPVSKSIEQSLLRQQMQQSGGGGGAAQPQRSGSLEEKATTKGIAIASASAATTSEHQQQQQLNPLQEARQNALARVRRKQQMSSSNGAGRKKCLSETESTQPAADHTFFVSQSSSSTSEGSGSSSATANHSSSSQSVSPNSHQQQSTTSGDKNSPKHKQQPAADEEKEEEEKMAEEGNKKWLMPREKKNATDVDNANHSNKLPTTATTTLQQRKCHRGGGGLSLVVPAPDKLLQMSGKTAATNVQAVSIGLAQQANNRQIVG